jgi:hypothetical protein
MNFIFIGFLLTVLLLGLIIAKKTKQYFSNNINSVILQMYVYGIMINICILGYILIVFKNTETLPGPMGPMGDTGPQGFEGEPGECKKCDKSNSNIVFNQNKERKIGEIFIETPTVSPNLVGKPV